MASSLTCNCESLTELSDVSPMHHITVSQKHVIKIDSSLTRAEKDDHQPAVCRKAASFHHWESDQTSEAKAAAFAFQTGRRPSGDALVLTGSDAADSHLRCVQHDTGQLVCQRHCSASHAISAGLRTRSGCIPCRSFWKDTRWASIARQSNMLVQLELNQGQSRYAHKHACWACFVQLLVAGAECRPRADRCMDRCLSNVCLSSQETPQVCNSTQR